MFKAKRHNLCKVVRDFNYFPSPDSQRLFQFTDYFFSISVLQLESAYLNVSDLGENVLSEGGNKVLKVEHHVSSLGVPMTTSGAEF